MGYKQLNLTNRISIKLGGLLLLLFLASGCANSSGGKPYVAPLSVRPIARNVRPIDPADVVSGSWREDSFVKSYKAGTPVFDLYRRKPGNGGDATDVDCQNVERIGISFFLDKSDLSAGTRNTKLTLHFRWLTPSTEEGESIVDYYEGAGFYSRLPHKTHEDIYAAGLLFTRREPHNGIYTVIVSYRGNELYRDAFNLVRCN